MNMIPIFNIDSVENTAMNYAFFILIAFSRNATNAYIWVLLY
jgi:hypothetical protein